MRARLIASLFCALLCATPAHAEKLTVFAAASLKNALDDVNAAFQQTGGPEVTASYAATSALVKQIEAGAPADVLLSADKDWMDYAVAHRLVDAGSRFDLLGNKLVLIAPQSSPLGNVHIEPGMNFLSLAGDSRVVTADVQAVPAGRYAKAALLALGVWETVQPRLLMIENVRAALAIVARREAALGIVYETDAAIEPRVKVVGYFPPAFFQPIVYPAAKTSNAGPRAPDYLAFLRGNTARAIFERYGFTALTAAQ